MRPGTAFTILSLAASATLNAQAMINPGMSKAQVIATLGPPSMQKTSGSSTFLYYRNGKEKTVGMADLVVLDADRVADAVFRSAARSYSGKSSSPSAIPAEVARKNPAAGPASPARSVAPAPNVARSGATKLPSQKTGDVVKPTPQARPAPPGTEKAATAKNTTAARKADSARTAKPDSNAKPVKKP